MTFYTPVAVIGYRRADKLQKLLYLLFKQNPGPVYAYLNAPSNEQDIPLCNEVLRVAKDFPITIIQREKHETLDNNLTMAVSETLEKHEHMLLFEDDAHPKPGCLDYLARSLYIYQNRPEIFSIGTYHRPVNNCTFPTTFLSPRFNCWAWATWRDRWNKIADKVMTKQLPWSHPYYIPDIAGQDIIDYCRYQQLHHKPVAWDMLVAAWCMKHRWYQVQPKNPAIINVGFDGTGTHCTADSKAEQSFLAAFNPDEYTDLNPDIQPDRKLFYAMRASYDKKKNVSAYKRLQRRLKNQFRVLTGRA